MSDMIHQHRSGPPGDGGDDRQQQGAAGEGDDVPAVASTRPTDQRRQPRHGLNAIDVLVANVTASLEVLGEMTGLETDAAVLAKLVCETFGGR